jgi:encapsulin shell SprI-like protein
MADTPQSPLALGDSAARQLANTTKTVPQLSTITPRWVAHLLQWVPVEAGIYRVNKVRNPEDVKIACAKRDEAELPQTFVDYEDKPREYYLNAVTTILDIHTRVSDLYSSPHDQIKEQLRLTIEAIKEHQESELINNSDYGLIANVTDQQRITPLSGAPTPDDLDELISRVWKEPAFFLTHPLAIAAFGRECTRRGVPPPTVSLFGSQFVTWRGLPLIPSDKVPVSDGKTKVLLLRVGDKRQGVVGLFQPGLPGEQSPGLSVRFMSISRSAIASYLVSLYCSLAVLTDDAVGLLDDVEVGKYHDYADTYR